MTIDSDKLKKAFRHLQAQQANLRVMQERPELTDLDREAIAESVIQRFEVCYDTLWKDLRRYLIENLGLPAVPNSPKPLFKLAGQHDLLPSPVETWLGYADARTSTTHDYSGDKAQAALGEVESFIGDVTMLLQKLHP
ncbi:MAG: nucleotidyltransferase substrate binding protein [Magnetococcales bacterium]|nr:nucleotidyltransferase substrate binding protein [Magnetococcales bacterium]